MMLFARVFLLPCLAFGAKQQQQLLHSDEPDGAQPMVHRPEARQEMMICNAFAEQSPLEAKLVQYQDTLKPLRYKECSKLDLPMREGDQLDFRCRGQDVGTFVVAGMPTAAKTLLLIVQRRSGSSFSASFKSHAFATEASGAAQVAVIDAFQGEHKRDQVRILDFSKDPTNFTMERKAEGLPMNSVVAVKPGFYRVALEGIGGEALDARPASSYVVVRVGQESPDKDKPGSFPEEVVVFPQTSGAPTAAALRALLALALALVQMLR